MATVLDRQMLLGICKSIAYSVDTQASPGCLSKSSNAMEMSSAHW